jgi:hypothetical protein
MTTDHTPHHGKTIESIQDTGFGGYDPGSVTLTFTDGTSYTIGVRTVSYGHGETGSALRFITHNAGQTVR